MKGRSNLSTSRGGLAPWRRAIVVMTILTFGAVANPSRSEAQTAPATLPPAAQPGRLQEQFQPPSTQPTAPPAITLPAVPTTAPPPNAANIHFQAQAIEIQGSTVYSPGELQALAVPYTNRTISVADLFQLADEITAKYRNDGYILSRAVVPAQNLSTSAASVRLTVVEGFVSSYQVQGYNSPMIEGYASQITTSRPLRAGDLERFMLLVNDLPGVTAHAVLSPASDVVGGTVLTVETTHKLYDATIAADNRGTEYIGPYQLYAGAGVNIPSWDGRLSGRWITTPSIRELQYGEASYQQNIGTDGLRMTLYGNDFKTRPGFTLAPFNTRSYGNIFTGTLTYPIIRSRSQNLEAHGLVGEDDLVTRVANNSTLPPSSNDHLRFVRAGLHYDLADQFQGVNIVTAEVSQGVKAFGASASGNLRPTPSRPNQSAAFEKFVGEVSRQQDLPWIYPGIGLLGAAEMQLSPSNALPASEQFGLGGPNYGRGYAPSDVVGDEGWAAKVEVQYTSTLPQDWQSWAGWLDHYQLYSFYDRGRVFHNVSSLGSAQLSSGGVGVRLAIANRVTADLEAAKPLSRDPSVKYGFPNSRPWHFFFSVSATY
jgi:hemolysin activation/secretion protein